MHAFRSMLLGRTLPVDAIRRAHQAERPVDDKGLDARPHFFVVGEEQILPPLTLASGQSSVKSGLVSVTDMVPGFPPG